MIKSYRVRPGFRFGALNQYEPGDVVQLEEAAALGFLDKLEPVEEVEEPPPAEPAKPRKAKS